MSPFDQETQSMVERLLAPNEGRERQSSGPAADPARFDPASPAFNPQLYENSPLSGSQKEQDYESNPNALFADRPPNLRILHEKPEHRIILFLKAQGLSNVEIARKTGFQNAWIGQVLRQPWARQRLVEELQAIGVDAISTMVKAAAPDAMWRLITEMDNEKARPSERTAAANAVLDRFLGKPVQHVESKADITNHTLSSLEELDKRLADLKQEEARLVGGN